MRFRPLASLLAIAFACTTATLGGGSTALADGTDDAQAFVQREHDKLMSLLRQPASPARAALVQRELDGIVDYDELARRAFGQPCPPTEQGCTDHWATLTDAQKTEVTGLIKQLFQKNYQTHLEKTLDYDVTYRGAKDLGGDTKIRTAAQSKLKPRDPPVNIDYVVHPKNGKLWMVDWVTEGSSQNKNYYDQNDKKMKDPALGYANIATKLREKIAK
jgi:ABC-type transporter MlaC component